MMTQREIVSAIVQLAQLDQPYVRAGDLVGPDFHVLVGLVWALTGQRPDDTKVCRRLGLVDLLKNHGVRCKVNRDGSVDVDSNKWNG